MTEDLTALKLAAEKATPGDLDTTPTKGDYGFVREEWLECPACGGSGEVEGKTFCNFDHKALGVQFFGIGNDFQNYEQFFRLANPAVVISLIDQLSAAQAEVERLRAALEPFAVMGGVFTQQDPSDDSVWTKTSDNLFYQMGGVDLGWNRISIKQLRAARIALLPEVK